ncbi:MAG: ATP-binding protein [Phycisphaerae bacterium]
MARYLAGVPSATAILDRFLHHAEILSITGRSYRLKDRATVDERAVGKERVGKESVQRKHVAGRLAQWGMWGRQ